MVIADWKTNRQGTNKLKNCNIYYFFKEKSIYGSDINNYKNLQHFIPKYLLLYSDKYEFF